jgi:carotenoid cleavage dioxygenase
VTSAIDVAANTNIVEINGRPFALIESGAPQYELSDELESIGYCDFDGTLDGAYTGHPHRDPATGELHAVSYYFGWGSKLRYTVLDKNAHVRKFVDIPVTGAPIVHDFALTKDYVVLYDLPVTMDVTQIAPTAPKMVQSVLSRILGKYAIPEPILARAARGAGKGKVFPYSWDPEYPARVGILPRSGTTRDVRWFDVDPCYVFHTMNAFQQGDDIVLDVVRHPKMFASDRAGPNSNGDGTPELYRWIVDTKACKVREHLIDGHSQEFPRFDERLQGHEYRFGYSVGSDRETGDPLAATVIIRHDLKERRSEVRSLGASRNAGEFVFVPDADDAPEDRGELMGYVYDGERNLSDLEILDAQTLEAVATVHLPVRVPYGFHGNWLPSSA